MLLLSCYFTKPARGLRGHIMKIQVQFSRTEVRKKFFSNRAIALWNSLPDNTVQADILDVLSRDWGLTFLSWPNYQVYQVSKHTPFSGPINILLYQYSVCDICYPLLLFVKVKALQGLCCKVIFLCISMFKSMFLIIFLSFLHLINLLEVCRKKTTF